MCSSVLLSNFANPLIGLFWGYCCVVIMFIMLWIVYDFQYRKMINLINIYYNRYLSSLLSHGFILVYFLLMFFYLTPLILSFFLSFPNLISLLYFCNFYLFFPYHLLVLYLCHISLLPYLLPHLLFYQHSYLSSSERKAFKVRGSAS